LLEVAAVARAGQQRAHVEGEYGGVLQHVGHFAMDDAAGEPFGDRGLADTGLADVKRVVLLPPAENLNGAVDFLLATDQRIDLAFLRLLVEVDAISFQRVALLLRLAVAAIAALGVAVLVVAAHAARLRKTRPFGDTVAD